MNNSMNVVVDSPEKKIWEGKAEWVSSKNSVGPFDILPFHSNFITIIENETIKIKTEKEIKELKFSISILYVHNNRVSIYVNI